MTLKNLKIGNSGIIKSMYFEGKQRLRIRELGFVEGAEVSALYNSMFGDPVAYKIRGSIIALRRDDADKIIIE